MTPGIVKPKQGIILISEPVLSDYYFRRSVVLLAEHNEDGTFGVIINKPIQTMVSDVMKDFAGFDAPVYLGGPVQTDSIFFIHTLPDVTGSMQILEGLYWGGDIQTIRELALSGKLREDVIRFFVGYSGWHPRQLDREISTNSWVLSHTTVEEVITHNPEKMWRDHLISMGKEYAIWANSPADPAMN